MTDRSEVLFIGGRSGVGKSAAAFRLHSLLAESDVKHCVIEGDLLDLAHPPPWEHLLAEKNLSAVWRNYRELGYRRLIYTNTVSVLQGPLLATAMGDAPLVVSVLLTANDVTIEHRLRTRESGASLEQHLARSRMSAARLDQEAPDDTHRLSTDGLTVDQIAGNLLSLIDWT